MEGDTITRLGDYRTAGLPNYKRYNYAACPMRAVVIHLFSPNHKGYPSHEAEDGIHPARYEDRPPSGR